MQLSAGVDEILETFECNQSSNTHDLWDMVGRDRRACGVTTWHRKTLKIDSVVNAMNLCRGSRTTLAKQVAAVIGFGGNKFRRGANLAEKIVAAEVLHKILPVRGHAEWNA